MEHNAGVVLSLYRHGVTTANQEKKYIGWTDAPIAKEGLEMLANTTLYRPEADRVIVSDLARCVESANQLFPNQKKIVHQGLREINFGDWEGKTADELTGRLDFSTWLNEPEKMEPENGESFSDFKARLHMTWGWIREWCYQDGVNEIAIVSHGGPIRQLLVDLAPEKKNFWEWKPLHGQGVTLFWSDRDAFRRGERCTLLSVVPIMAKDNG